MLKVPDHGSGKLQLHLVNNDQALPVNWHP